MCCLGARPVEHVNYVTSLGVSTRGTTSKYSHRRALVPERSGERNVRPAASSRLVGSTRSLLVDARRVRPSQHRRHALLHDDGNAHEARQHAQGHVQRSNGRAARFRRRVSAACANSDVKKIVSLSQGWVLIDRCGKHFAKILNYFRDSSTPLPEAQQDLEELLAEAKYYLIEDLERQIQTRLMMLRDPCPPMTYVPVLTASGQLQKILENSRKVEKIVNT